MKTSRRLGLPVRFLSGCVTVLLRLTGCQTSPCRRGDAASRGLALAVRAVEEEQVALREAIGSLQELMGPDTSEPRTRFPAFAGSLDRLEAAARRARQAGNHGARRAEAILMAWDDRLTQFSFGAVQEQSASRREEVAVALALVHGRYAYADTAMGPLIASLRDIQLALDADLTPQGLESVATTGKNAQVNARGLQEGLKILASELETLSIRMSAFDPGRVAGAQLRRPSSSGLARPLTGREYIVGLSSGQRGRR